MKKQESPIYSKINYENAYSAKKDLLGVNLNLLNTLKLIEQYRLMRKQELMLKLKLKNDLKKTKLNLSKIIERLPQTQGTKEAITEHKEAKKIKKETKGLANLEEELIDIQRKLKEMD